MHIQIDDACRIGGNRTRIIKLGVIISNLNGITFSSMKCKSQSDFNNTCAILRHMIYETR